MGNGQCVLQADDLSCLVCLKHSGVPQGCGGGEKGKGRQVGIGPWPGLERMMVAAEATAVVVVP